MSRLELPKALVRWSGPALAAAGGVIYVWYALQAPSARGVVGFAIVTSVHAYDLSLPLLGAGLILARIDQRAATAGYSLFLVALTGSVLTTGPLADWLIVTPGAIERFVLVGPASAIMVGAALVLPDAFRRWLAPVAMLLTGMAFGISIRLFDPTGGDRRFAVTLIVVALWLVSVSFLIGRRQRRPWFTIATRIVGSWLIAIGMLLGAFLVLPRQNADTLSPASDPPPAVSIPPRDGAVDGAATPS